MEAATKPKKAPSLKRKKKPAPRRKAQSPKPRQDQPLPPPLPVNEPHESPEPASPQPGGLLGGLFGSSKPQPSEAAASSIGSALPSSEISAEVKAELNRIPDVIGEAPGLNVAGQGSDDGEQLNPDAIRGLMEMVAFDERDIRDLLEEFCEWMADRCESEHWKLSERQSRMLGKPYALLANAMWAKLCAYIPEILGRWIENTPGAAAALMATGIVFGPKILMQARVSRERRSIPEKSAEESKKPAQTEAPSQPIHHGGSIPVASGKVV